MSALAHQVHRGVLHRQQRADVAIHPLHHRVLVRHRPLRHQVVDVVRPVLDRRVPDPRVLLHDHLHHRRVQRRARVDRRRAALHVVQVAALFGNDQRPLKLTHVLRVDPEVCLQRHVQLHALRHIDERTAGPHRAVQRRVLVVTGRNDRPKVLPDNLRVLRNRLVHPQEDHALLRQVLADVVVHHLGVVLRPGACQERLLRLRDAQLVERVLDVLRNVVPVRRILVRRLHVVVDVIEVQRCQRLWTARPLRILLLKEALVRVQPVLQHPRRLVLHLRHLADDALVQALLRDVQRRLVIVEAPLVLPHRISRDIFRGRNVLRCSHAVTASVAIPSSCRIGS